MGLLEVVAVLFALSTPPSLVESVVLELAPLRVGQLGNTENGSIRMALK